MIGKESTLYESSSLDIFGGTSTNNPFGKIKERWRVAYGATAGARLEIQRENARRDYCRPKSKSPSPHLSDVWTKKLANFQRFNFFCSSKRFAECNLIWRRHPLCRYIVRKLWEYPVLKYSCFASKKIIRYSTSKPPRRKNWLSAIWLIVSPAILIHQRPMEPLSKPLMWGAK